MLRQPIAWHDDDQTNAVGMLSSKLASEAGYIKGLTGQLLGVMLRVAVTLAVGFGIAFASCWQVTLIVVAILPILAGAQALQFRRLQG